MGSINQGSQTITIDYKNPITSASVNKLLYKTLSTGIYEGLTLTIINNTTTQISTGVLQINNSEDTTDSPMQSVRVETTAAFNVTTSTIDCYVIARFTYAYIEDNYCDFLAVGYDDITANDIILGRVLFAGSVATDIDYSLTSYSHIKLLSDRNNYFRVENSDPLNETNSLAVFPGKCIIDNKYIDYAGTISTGVTNSVTDGMISILAINSSGSLVVRNSSDTPSPTTPSLNTNEMLIAIITRGASSTGIKTNEINSFHGLIRYYHS